MKKLALAALMFMAIAVNGQIIGFNGTNTPEMLNSEVRGYLRELTVDTLGFVFRVDKYQGNIAPDEDVNNVIALSNDLQADSKTLAVCVTLYTRDSNYNASNDLYTLNRLIESGLYVYSVRFGNEEFAKEAKHGKKGGDFNEYWKLCTPYLPALTSYGVQRILIPVARPADQPTWNSAAASKINSDIRFQPDYHPYWGPKQATVLDTLNRETLPTANPIQYLPFHDWFYDTLYQQVLAYDLIGEIVTWHRANIPSKEYHVTEFGPPTAVGHISNAMGFDATTDWFLNEWPKRTGGKFIARFNGPSPTGTGIITPRSKKDDPSLPVNVKRLAYYTMYNAIRNKGSENTRYFDAAGLYTVSLSNMGRTPLDYREVFSTGQNYAISGFSYTYVSGQYYYTGSGAIEWWDKSSPKTYQIAGLQTSGDIPAISYGYATVTVREKVRGCTDPQAINYNPQAEVNDGTCYYQSDCGCKDVTASNYDALAPCEDNTKCTYPPVECYKKRWLFASLPCKPSKTRCDCK